MIPAQRSAVRRTTAAPEGPASLTQLRRRAAECPECGSARITALTMTLTDGTPVQFASCHECEHRAWSHEGARLEFSDVIARTTRQKVS
jgi:DNA-directed RNA polymerase subunit M/transcription elongation factor TFIIS